MQVTLLSLGSVLAVSLVSLSGLLTLSISEAGIRRLATVLVSLAVGALLGDAFIHLIPQIFAEQRVPPVRQSLLILGGMMLFFVLEKLLVHAHGPLHAQHHGQGPAGRPELAAINIVGDALHNFIDGVLIGASYLESSTLGVGTTLAVLLHEIPQELGDFGILLHSGLDARRAVLLNFASACVAVLGTILALLGGAVVERAVPTLLMPIAAGGFVYLAAAGLIPELQHDRSLRALVSQTAIVSLGIALMALLKLLE